MNDLAQSDIDARRGYLAAEPDKRQERRKSARRSMSHDYAPSLSTVQEVRRPKSGLLPRVSMFCLGIGCAIALFSLLDQLNAWTNIKGAWTATADFLTWDSDETGATERSIVDALAKAKPKELPEFPALTSDDIADAITGPINQFVFPEHIKVTFGDQQLVGTVNYGIDPILQTEIQGVFEHYKPDYGAFIALEPDTGVVLAMASFTKVDPSRGNLTLHAGYPAASVFKIVTAAAGIDRGLFTPNTIIPYNGKSTALYKKHVLKHKDNKWTRRPTLIDAFAKSINPVFGRIGVFDLGANALTEYAENFGFNRQLSMDIRLNDSQMSIVDADEWSVAEAASGYTRRNKISPIHGAMMAASIVNNGEMMLPRLVRSVVSDTGKILYQLELTSAGNPITAATASSMRKLMQATVRKGSARKSFRNFFKGDYADVEVGGKTGSLTGLDPKGRNDWFVGYAERGERRIAYAALTVNVEKWTVKSSYVARKAVEAWFRPDAKVAAALK